MSNFLTDLSGVITNTSNVGVTAKHSTNTKAGQELVMDDFLKLMIASFQNQSIDDVASTSDMMNQMVQMSVINAVTNVNKLLTESTGLSTAASLVGKEVTIGQRSGNEMYTVTGTVTGTGTLNGEQVVFLGDESYMLSEVLAVGKLPSTAKVNNNKSVTRTLAEIEQSRARSESTYPTVTPRDDGPDYDSGTEDAIARDFFTGLEDGALEEETREEEVVYYPVGTGTDAQPGGSVEDGYETAI
ncbi:MAG: hypothetical protein IJ617_04320 [Oscillospiraceae bacterium]|nr:hypothetical protein [Oscillospiraceae bacterium]